MRNTALVTVTMVVLLIFVSTTSGQTNNEDDGKKLALIHAQAAQGKAQEDTVEAANLLILVADAQTGAPIKGLTQSNFTVKNHFKLLGQNCSCSHIKEVSYAGKGAYRLKIGFNPKKSSCFWVKGEYLLQIAVDHDKYRGQAATQLSIR